MFISNLLGLILSVIFGTRITGWFVPLVTAQIAGLLIKDVHVLIVLGVCLLGAAIGDAGLWFFDTEIHHVISKKLKYKNHKHIHKQTHLGLWTHELWEKAKLIEKKRVLFFAIMGASFSVVPDILIVEFARKKMHFLLFILAISLGKIVVYGSLIWGGIEIVELFH